MIESGADVNRRDDIGWSPLTVAVSKSKMVTKFTIPNLFSTNSNVKHS